MAKIRRETPPPHIIVPDTNILWHEDKSLVVSPDFESFWNEYSRQLTLRLIIPEVVRGELLFQQTTSATKSLSIAIENLEKVGRITQKKFRKPTTPEITKKRIEKRFDNWLNRSDGSIEPTPIEDIDWRHMVNSAIWRDSPFTFDPKNRDSEKGFRDALILETVPKIVSSNSSEFIAFVSNDTALRETLDKRISILETRYSSYESLSDLGSYFRLIHERLTSSFVKGISRTARRRFFKIGSESCLWYKDSIRDQILKKYSSEFRQTSNQSDDPNPLSEFFSSITTEGRWEAPQSGHFFISNAQFDKIEKENIFYWITPVEFVRPFRRISAPSTFLGLTTDEPIVERIEEVRFNIRWTARVTEDGRFRKISLDDINFEGKSFEAPTEEQRKSYFVSAE